MSHDRPCSPTRTKQENTPQSDQTLLISLPFFRESDCFSAISTGNAPI
jgi:hypothetical protein